MSTKRRRRWGRVRLRDVMPRDLFRRSLLMVAIPILLLFGIATWFFFDRHWDSVQRRMVQSAVGDLAFVVRSHEAGGLPAEVALRLERSTQVRCVPDEPTPETEQPAIWFRPAITELKRTLASSLSNIPHRADGLFGDDLHLTFETMRGPLNCRLPLKSVATSTTVVFLIWVLGTALLVLAISAYFLWRQTVPIKRLAAAMDAFGKGEDLGAIPERGADEVRRTARAFERMKARIGRQVRRRTEMLAAISHDLRTPLSRMRLEVEMLADSADREGLRQDIAEMERMIQGYLEFARDQAAEPTAVVDLVALLGSVVESFRHDRIELAHGDILRLQLRLRPEQIRRSLANLIANALRYGQCCWVTLESTPHMVLIHIDDDGPGIPDDHRADVFRPFVRLDASRNAATGGVGLGLTIARDAVLSHGGDIVVADSPRAGARFTMTLPR